MSDTESEVSGNDGKAAPVVLVIEDDLFFSVRIETVLQKLGYAVQVIGDHAQALDYARQHALALVIINFGSDHLVPADVVRHLKALPNPVPVMGFVPHVWMPQVRPAAMAAGCDLLVANSALVMRLPQLLEKLLTGIERKETPPQRHRDTEDSQRGDEEG